MFGALKPGFRSLASRGFLATARFLCIYVVIFVAENSDQTDQLDPHENEFICQDSHIFIEDSSVYNTSMLRRCFAILASMSKRLIVCRMLLNVRNKFCELTIPFESER